VLSKVMERCDVGRRENVNRIMVKADRDSWKLKVGYGLMYASEVVVVVEKYPKEEDKIVVIMLGCWTPNYYCTEYLRSHGLVTTNDESPTPRIRRNGHGTVGCLTVACHTVRTTP
jgi:hypothetical protein